MRKQRGYFLFIAVILVLVMGSMGVITAYLLASRARMSVALQGGMSAFYVAEAGLEASARALVGSSTVSCSALTGTSSLTNASILGGTFTATAVNGGLYTGSSTLSSSITATSNSLPLASVSGFAPHGRVRIDSEAIDYAAISGSSLVGLNRGAGGTTANTHAANASVSQSVCLVDVVGGVPSVSSPTYQRELQMAVEILTSSDIWAVGARTGNLFSIMRYNSSWTNYSFTDVSNRNDLNAVSAASTSLAWAVGAAKGNNFNFVVWNGSSWSASPLPNACSGQDLTDVSVVGSTEGWAVGSRYRPGCGSSGNFRYTMFKWNGTTWTILSSATSPAIPADSSSVQNLNAIDMYDSNGDGLANFGFAVGNSGTILQYNGTSWVAVASGTSNNINDVVIVSTTEAWAVTSTGGILKWNGSTWSSVASPTSASLTSIDMLDTSGSGSAGIGFAVATNGTIIYYNGTTWTTQTSPTTNSLNDVVVISSTSAWIIGNSGTLLQWNGTSWSTTTSPITVNLNGLGVYRGGTITSSGSKVGSWQQIFN